MTAHCCVSRFLRLAVLFGLLGSVGLRAEISKEYQVKAAFLYNFTKFVEWPPEQFHGPADPIVIAVLGRNPFGAELEKIVRHRIVNGRPISVLFLASAPAAGSAPPAVHVLFAADGEEKLLRGVLGSSPAGAILTVGESSRFTELGGVITFVVLDEKVRFEINSAHAAAARVKISAQLRKLATPAPRPARGSTP